MHLADMKAHSFCTIAVMAALGGETCHAASSATSSYTIAFTSFSPLNSDVFIADADGSNARPFLPDPELDSNASFSSDGNWVVFTSRRNGSSDIYRAHLDGSGLQALVDDGAYDDQAALSPDGNSLAFVSSRTGQADIWIIDLESGSVRNIRRAFLHGVVAAIRDHHQFGIGMPRKECLFHRCFVNSRVIVGNDN